MERIRLAALCLLPLLGLLLVAGAHNRSLHSQSTRKQPSEATPAIAFTVESKDKVVRFFDPLDIRVVVRNNSSTPISLDPRSLRLIPESWHVVGAWGQWMEGEGLPLSTKTNHAGRIELPVGRSLSLQALDEDSSFERLGPVRVSYLLKSTDPASQQFMPATPEQLSFEVPPTDLISGVWTARTEADLNRIQPAFNEFLKFRAAVQTDDEQDFLKRRSQQIGRAHV